VERDKPKKSESVEQTLPQLPWKQKREDLNKNWIPFSSFFVATAAILKFLRKLCVHMSDKISGKFHPIPSTIANQR
jgi:hypothetical protein